MSAARWAAAAIVVVTLAMNAGTVWVLFGTEFLSRFAQPGLTESYVVFVYAAVAGFGCHRPPAAPRRDEGRSHRPG